MLLKFSHVRKRIDQDRTHLRAMGVLRIRVFGSFARGEQRPDSDVDVLVELDRPMGLFEFMDLQQHLEALLGRRVDLATPEMLHRSMKEKILLECIDA
ncbi:MAG: nucleotidyltransferase family protein [Magnetospirillum sp. WYHS-4]